MSLGLVIGVVTIFSHHVVGVKPVVRIMRGNAVSIGHDAINETVMGMVTQVSGCPVDCSATGYHCDSTCTYVYLDYSRSGGLRCDDVQGLAYILTKSECDAAAHGIGVCDDAVESKHEQVSDNDPRGCWFGAGGGCAFASTTGDLRFNYDNFGGESSSGRHSLCVVQQSPTQLPTQEPAQAPTASPTQAPTTTLPTQTCSYVEELYQTVLCREGKPHGIRFYRDECAKGVSRSQMETIFRNSPEYQACPACKNDCSPEPADCSFVKEVFRDILCREGKPHGIKFYEDLCARGMSRSYMEGIFRNQQNECR